MTGRVRDVRVPDLEETGLSPAEVWQGLREGTIAGPRAWACAMLVMPVRTGGWVQSAGADGARSRGLASSRYEVLEHAE